MLMPDFNQVLSLLYLQSQLIQSTEIKLEIYSKIPTLNCTNSLLAFKQTQTNLKKKLGSGLKPLITTELLGTLLIKLNDYGFLTLQNRYSIPLYFYFMEALKLSVIGCIFYDPNFCRLIFYPKQLRLLKMSFGTFIFKVSSSVWLGFCHLENPRKFYFFTLAKNP